MRATTSKFLTASSTAIVLVATALGLEIGAGHSKADSPPEWGNSETVKTARCSGANVCYTCETTNDAYACQFSGPEAGWTQGDCQKNYPGVTYDCKRTLYQCGVELFCPMGVETGFCYYLTWCINDY